jgi:hypothetical protein
MIIGTCHPEEQQCVRFFVSSQVVRQENNMTTSIQRTNKTEIDAALSERTDDEHSSATDASALLNRGAATG